MPFSSHRIRAEERRATRKLLLTVGILISSVLLIIFAGLPLMVKLIGIFSSFNSLKSGSNITSSDAAIILPPVLDPVAEATNSGKINISGYGEKDSVVKIILNGTDYTKAKTDEEGKFTALNIPLTEGNNIISAVNMRDKLESTSSSPISVIFKKNTPKLEVNSPKDGDKFSSDNKKISISGNTDQGNRVTINDRYVIVDPEGKFNYAVELGSGENKFTIKSFDDAGNQTSTDIKVSLNAD